MIKDRNVKKEVCQYCGEFISWGENVIAIRYGTITRSVRHTTVSKEKVDYFHWKCKGGACINSFIFEDGGA